MPFSQSGTKLQMFFQVSGEPVGFFLPNPPYHFYFPPASSSPTRTTARTYAGPSFSNVCGTRVRAGWGEINSTALSKTGHFLHIHPRKPNLPDRRLHIRENQVWTMQRRLVLLAQASYRQCHEGWKLWWCNHKYRMRHLGFRWSYNINIFLVFNATCCPKNATRSLRVGFCSETVI